MGLFDQINDFAKGILADAERQFGRLTSRDTFQRVVNAAFLIARADGTFDPDEKATLQKIVSAKLPHFKAADIVAAITAAEGELAFSEVAGTQSLVAEIAKARGTDQAQLIMVVVLAIANADGTFDDSEKAVARQISAALGLDPASYRL